MAHRGNAVDPEAAECEYWNSNEGVECCEGSAEATWEAGVTVKVVEEAMEEAVEEAMEEVEREPFEGISRLDQLHLYGAQAASSPTEELLQKLRVAAIRLVLSKNLNPWVRLGARVIQESRPSAAFKLMAKLVHPDHHQNSPEANSAMKELNCCMDSVDTMSTAEVRQLRSGTVLQDAEYEFYLAWCRRKGEEPSGTYRRGGADGFSAPGQPAHGPSTSPSGGGGGSGETSVLLFEPVDVSTLQTVRSLEVAQRVMVEEHGARKVSLAMACHFLICRAELFNGHIPVVLREERLATLFGAPLRRYSGVPTPEGWAHLDSDVQQKLNALVSSGMTPFEATCSPFVWERAVKEVLRAGTRGIDLDQSASHWRAVEARHQDSALIRDYLARHEQLVLEAGGGSRDKGKALYTGLITGGGEDHFAKWHKTCGTPVPVHARLLAKELARLRDLDAKRHPELLEALKRAGRSRPELTLTAVLNERFEREYTDRMMEAIGGMCQHYSVEHDGVFMWASEDAAETWEADIAFTARQAVPTVKAKPYRSLEQLLQEFSAVHDVKPDQPTANPSLCDESLELRRWLARDRGRSVPDTLISSVAAASSVMRRGVQKQLRDVYKLVPCHDPLKAQVATRQDNGSRWVLQPRHTMYRGLRDCVTETVKAHLPHDWAGDPPLFCRKGKQLNAMVSTIIDEHLYDIDFHRKMDCKETLRYLVFEDGVCLDRETMEPLPAVPDGLVITKSCSIPWPAARLAELQAAEAAAEAAQPGSSLRSCFESWYAMHVIWGAQLDPGHDITAGLKDRLHRCASRIPILRHLYNCWEDWVLTLYVISSVMHRVFGLTFLEQFDIWRGGGQNGKGFLMSLIKSLIGSYYMETHIALLTERSRSVDSPSPGWMALRGKRVVAITEAEGMSTLQSSVVKLLRDPATEFQSRNLQDALVPWSPTFGLFMCTNVKLRYSTADGGIERSQIVTDFPFKFTGHPREPHHRPVDVSLKEPRRLAPEFLYILMEIRRVLLASPGVKRDTLVRPLPHSIAMSSASFLREIGEGGEAEFVETRLETVQDPALATTASKVIDALMADLGIPNNRANRRLEANAIEQFVVNINDARGRDLLRLKGKSHGFLRLRAVGTPPPSQ